MEAELATGEDGNHLAMDSLHFTFPCLQADQILYSPEHVLLFVIEYFSMETHPLSFWSHPLKDLLLQLSLLKKIFFLFKPLNLWYLNIYLFGCAES